MNDETENSDQNEAVENGCELDQLFETGRRILCVNSVALQSSFRRLMVALREKCVLNGQSKRRNLVGQHAEGRAN